MITIEIHGLGRERAENLCVRILESISNIAWIDKNLIAVEIYNTNIRSYSNKERPQLRLLTSYSEVKNFVIIGQLTKLELPIYILRTQVFDGKV